MRRIWAECWQCWDSRCSRPCRHSVSASSSSARWRTRPTFCCCPKPSRSPSAAAPQPPATTVRPACEKSAGSGRKLSAFLWATDDDAQLHADLTDDGQRQNGVSIMNTLARKLKDGGRATELKIFNEEELSAALSVYVDKEENGAFDTFCTKAMKETQHRLLTTTGARGDGGGGGGGGKPHDSCLESSLERSAHHSDPSDACNDPSREIQAMLLVRNRWGERGGR